MAFIMESKKSSKDRWFLGGTCSGQNWRKDLIPYLEERNIEYFNPLIKGRAWAKEDEDNEYIEKNKKCNIHLFLFTPDFKGIFSIAEVVNSCWEVKTNTNVVKHVYFVTLGYFEQKSFKRIKPVMRMCKNIAGDKVTTLNAKYIEDIFEEVDQD